MISVVGNVPPNQDLRGNLESFVERGRARSGTTTHILFPDDVAWLRNRFHETDFSLHGETLVRYLDVVRDGRIDRPFTDTEKRNGRILDLTDLQGAVADEFDSSLHRYRSMWSRPSWWRLQWNWRKYLYEQEMKLQQGVDGSD